MCSRDFFMSMFSLATYQQKLLNPGIVPEKPTRGDRPVDHPIGAPLFRVPRRICGQIQGFVGRMRIGFFGHGRANE
jgi:hypothetical protein